MGYRHLIRFAALSTFPSEGKAYARRRFVRDSWGDVSCIDW
jgi:hypothetical protein